MAVLDRVLVHELAPPLREGRVRQGSMASTPGAPHPRLTATPSVHRNGSSYHSAELLLGSVGVGLSSYGPDRQSSTTATRVPSLLTPSTSVPLS